MKHLTPFLAMRAAYSATLRASRDARLSRDAARKAAESAISAAILVHQERCKTCKCGDEIQAASDAYDKTVKEAHDHYDRTRKYASNSISKSRKARYALDAASCNERDHLSA